MFDLAGYKIFFIILQVLLPYFLVLRMILLVNILWIYDSLYVTFFFFPSLELGVQICLSRVLWNLHDDVIDVGVLHLLS